MWPTYHTVLVGSLPTHSEAYLFARFAWAVIFQTKPFVIEGQRRHIFRICRDEAGETKYKKEYRTRAELEEAYGDGGSKTATPKSKSPDKAVRQKTKPVLQNHLRAAMSTGRTWIVYGMCMTRQGEEETGGKSRQRKPAPIPWYT